MRILGIGVATLDIVNLVPSYPHEDAELRAESQEYRRGGNATNTLVVLSQLGHQCSWAGTLADEPDSRFILEDLKGFTIDTQACRYYPAGKVPTSYITLSLATGSRTIVHYRNLPEYLADDFRKIDTSLFDWVHFEGRNVPQTRRMMQDMREKDPARPISLEVEKERDGIDSLFSMSDVLMFSKGFVQGRGFSDPAALFAAIRPQNERALLVCAWGEAGAWTQNPGGEVAHVSAHRPPKLVDTLGAGDVFNAGMIHGLVRRVDTASVLRDAVRLAGEKCGRYGLSGLVKSDD
jgi:ketohexokinase